MKTIEKIFLVLIGLFFGQSSVISGVNLSFSDVFLIIYICYLILQKEKWINIKIFISYISLVTYLLFLNTFITPFIWDIQINLNSTLVELLKLTILFLYLNLGIYLYFNNKYRPVLKSFVFSSIIISILGILLNFTQSSLRELLFFGDFRFKGLLNDPNLFAVTQIIAMSLLSIFDIKLFNKLLYYLIILSSIVLSGSKTGLICLLVFIIISFLKILTKLKFIEIFKYSCLLIVAAIIFFCFKDIIVPKSFLTSLSRMSLLLSDTNLAINEGGSERGEAWETAFKIISNSYFLGTGLGTYLLISKQEYATYVLAHNTYLQLGAEWGMFITSLLFITVIYKIVIAFLLKKRIKDVFFAELIFYYLIGSLALSLNNSRFFWFLLGPFFFFKIKKDINLRGD